MSDSEDDNPKHITDNRGTNNMRLLDHLANELSQCKGDAPGLLSTMEADALGVTKANTKHEKNLREGERIDESDNEHDRQIVVHEKAKEANIGKRKQNKRDTEKSREAKKVARRRSDESTKKYDDNKHKRTVVLPNKRTVINNREASEMTLCVQHKTNLRANVYENMKATWSNTEAFNFKDQEDNPQYQLIRKETVKQIGNWGVKYAWGDG